MEVTFKRSPYSGKKFDLTVVYADDIPSNPRGVIYQPQVLDSVKDDCNDDGSVLFIHSDVHALMHQKTLDKLGNGAAVRNYLDQLMSVNDSSSMPEGVTDNDLFDYVKSRYIQSPSELQSYIKRLSSDTKNKVEQYLLSKKAESNAKSEGEQVEQVKSD